MLQIELVEPNALDKAATIFHRDGFVAIKDALSPAQLEFAQAGAHRVIAEQTSAIVLEEANRGFARYSFGDQIRHPEWAMLIDLPTTLPIIDRIWDSTEYSCTGGGGDYSVPGAKIQPLHSDMGDFFRDPLGQTTFRDVPAPFIVVNFLMVDFTKENGAIRFIPGTQRSHHPIPALEEEPAWMQNSIVCAPAGTALIRDVRCWHGGTANQSHEIRPMTSVGYFAPWFQIPDGKALPRALYDTLSPRAQQLARRIVVD
ncbi:MAG TPA: phytanoyl-CoA dioxygenase family protein [Abditibacteriaceae bacterium]|nr:phytanoyl-CoA dioxygenase family protein [Abditibacteriaceae bacterium]